VEKLKSQTPVPEYSVDEFFKIESSFRGSYSPDYKKFIYISNKSGVYNIWLYDLKKKKSKLFFKSEGNIFWAFWHKKNNKVYYSQDRDGNENHNFFEFDPVKKKSKKILGQNTTKVSVAGVSRDYDTLMYLENNRDVKYFDLYSYHFSSGKKNFIWKCEGKKVFSHWIEKKNQIILAEEIGDERNKIYLYDIKKKKEFPLIMNDKFSYEVVADDLDGNHLYIISNKDGEFRDGFKFNIKKKKFKKIISHNWNVVRIGRSFNKKYYYYLTNENGYYILRMFSDEFKTPVKTPKLASGQIILQTLERDEKHAAFRYINDASPGNIYLWDLETNHVERVTNNLPDTIKEEHLVTSHLISYKTRDNLTVRGFLYLPKQPMPEKGYPLMMYIHGGPKWHYSPSFRFDVQYLVNRGYAVFAPNVRGSTGYGKSFHMMDNLDFGGKPLLDVVDGKNYLASKDYIDGSRIGIIGGSYGGYMVLAALAFTPKEFKLGVDIVGPSNLITLVESFPKYWTSFLKYIYEEFGDPKKDAKYMKERSPLFSADKIVRPLIIFHGKNDVRVKLPEAQTIFKALKDKKRIVELYVYDDEGHGFRSTKNRIDYLKKTIKFLKKYL
jgi:dipeptidyl aminopeptidase/acylaminoacyl peptidase